jgi:hypothetical protein
MSERGANSLAGFGVPDLRGVVIGSGDDATAVGAELGRSYGGLMCQRGTDWLAGIGVPDLRRMVIGNGDDAAAVGAEGGGKHS